MSFLKNPSYVLTNLKPDENNMIKLDNIPLHLYSTLCIIVTNAENITQKVIPLNNTGTTMKDISLKSQMNLNKAYCIKRETTNLVANETFECEDLSRIEL